MIIGIDDKNRLWIEVGNDSVIKSVTTAEADGSIRTSALPVSEYVTFGINHEDLIKALVAMRDGTAEPAWLDEVRDSLRKEDLIRAIKIWRKNTGDGLKESKDRVEELRDKEGL